MRLRYIGLGVSDVEAATTFFRDDWRLEPAGDDSGAVLFTTPASEDPFVLRLRPATANRIDVFAFDVGDRDALARLHAHLMSAPGARVVGDPAPLDHAGGGYGFQCFDPEGFLLEFAADVTHNQPENIAAGSGLPLRLSHYVVNSTDAGALIDWYCEHLGFRVTDRLEDKLVFLTTTDQHHQLAIGAASVSSLNHIAYDCGNVDDFMRATGRMVRRGHPVLWGPGRHGPGDNTYAYFRDVSGFVHEYTTGLESVADPDWEVRTWMSVPEQSDQWGTSNPHPGPAFATPQDPGVGTLPGRPGEP
jgi:catechol 2,3-dioxygenase-like lactoylglutathione lyase family enzyme